MEQQPTIEFKRRIDGIVYCFNPSEPINEMPSRKRDDADLRIIYMNDFGWVCIDENKSICGIPWGIALNEMGKLPPEGEWVSKKSDKSYVYDLIYLHG